MEKPQLIDIIPQPYVRQVSSDKYKKRPAVLRYRAYAEELRLKYKHHLPADICIGFVIPIAKGRRMASKKYPVALNAGMPHQQTPDLDNLVKAVLDALCIDDSYVHSIMAFKVWGDTGLISISEGVQGDNNA
jgi:Holliday junction resolvase RusA-like endonuclease